MADNIPFSSGGSLPKLSTDLTYPSTIENGTGIVIVPGIDATGSLTQVLSLTGGFAINNLALTNMTAENATIKLTVDGDVKWDNTYTAQTSVYLIGQISSGVGGSSRYQCNSSLLLEVQMATDTNIQLQYSAQPIA
jgi:hypothetical protein